MSIHKLQKVIDVSDWDELVTTTYNRPYSFQQQDGCKERQRVHITIPDEPYDYENDSVPEEVNGEEMGVSFKAWLERDPNKSYQTIKIVGHSACFGNAISTQMFKWLPTIFTLKV